jgi:hypothetical protein
LFYYRFLGVNSPVLAAAIAQELQSELSLLVYNTGRGSWREFANKVRLALPDAAVPSHKYLETALDVKGILKLALNRTNELASQWYGI